MMIRLNVRLLASLLLAVVSTPLLAQSWYQVNLVVFENRSVVSGDENLNQPEGVVFTAPENVVDVDSIAESGNEQGFQRTTVIDPEFNGVVGSLQRSGGYRVLLVKSWRQPGLEREQSVPVLIQGGDRFGQHRHLEGTVRLVLSRYLHLETDLWLGNYVQQSPLLEEDNQTPSPSLVVEGSTDMGAPALQFVPSHLVRLLETRRMRSKELHFIDHPNLGVIAKVIPLADTPDTNRADDESE